MKNRFMLRGVELIAGVDEVGLAAGWPVVAAAVILPKLCKKKVLMIVKKYQNQNMKLFISRS